ncbi:MAG: glycosyltransferase [Fibrobacterales bacterium]|nr:glycosyltransferase [Fibrobacterales bacterium]
MKVLHLATSLSGGAGIAALRLHQAMRSQGVDSRMVALRCDFPDEHLAELPRWKGRLVAPVRESLSWKLDRKRVDQTRGLFSFARHGFDVSDHPWVDWADVVYLHWVVGGFLSLKNLGKLFRTGKKFRWTMHDMWPFTGGCHHAWGCNGFAEKCEYCPHLAPAAQRKARAQLAAKRRLFENTDLAFVAPSQWLADLAAQAPVCVSHTVARIPNVLDGAFRPAEDRARARAEFGLDNGRRWALCFASNDPYKGWKLFRDTWNSADLTDDCGLVVCGDETLARELAHSERIRAIPTIRDKNTLVRLYSAADFFILPSLAENYPNVAVEALACGTPVLGTNVGGIPEIVEKWGGIVAEPAADTFANALTRMAREELPHAQSELIRAEHATENIIKLHLAL